MRNDSELDVGICVFVYCWAGNEVKMRRCAHSRVDGECRQPDGGI